MTAVRGEDEMVDGVLVHHVPADDEVTRAVLTFGVGERDETLPTQGVLHALEHIVMDAVRRTPLEINAGVEASTTQFVVSGSPDRVGDYLRRLCLALADPPVNRLPAEAPILAAELGSVDRPEGPLLAARYGLRDLGVTTGEGPGPDGLRNADVAAAAARWFVTGNAVLVLEGPRPDRLQLPLPVGPAPPHQRPDPRRWPGPHAALIDQPACMVSLLLPPQTPDRLDRLAVDLITARLTEALRHREGLSYVVDERLFPVGNRLVDLVVRAEPPPDRAVRAAETMVIELRSLLQDGPTAAELELAVLRVEEQRRGREARIAATLERSLDQLLGWESFPLPTGGPPPDPTAVSDYLRALEPDLLYVLPDDPAVRRDRLGLGGASGEPLDDHPLPGGRRFTPPLLAKVLSAEARQATVALEPDGISQQLGTEVRSIPWAEVAGLMEVDEDETVVFGSNGVIIPIGPGLYRDGDALVAAARAAVPPERHYRRSRFFADDD